MQKGRRERTQVQRRRGGSWSSVGGEAQILAGNEGVKKLRYIQCWGKEGVRELCGPTQEERDSVQCMTGGSRRAQEGRRESIVPARGGGGGGGGGERGGG